MAFKYHSSASLCFTTPLKFHRPNSGDMRTISPSASATPPPPPPLSEQIRPWHSPVPYLFGGLAAMLGLISFALLLLGCSYWKLSAESEDRDLEAANNEEKIKDEQQQQQPLKVYEQNILVIMAGDQKPTFLATPAAAPKVLNPFCESNHVSVENEMDSKELGHRHNDLQHDQA